MVKLVESYYEDKYTDLERKKVEAESDFKYSYSAQYERDQRDTLANEENKNEANNGNYGNNHEYGFSSAALMNNEANQVNIDDIWNAPNYGDPNRAGLMQRDRNIVDQNANLHR